MLHSEVLVVGAGPAGLAAARAAGQVAQVTLLDDNPAVGGQIWRGKQVPPLPGKVQVLTGQQVLAMLDDRTLLLKNQRIRFERLILAPGARELFLPFPGWTLPGVVGAGGLQAMVKGGHCIAGKRVLIAGSGPLLLAVAALARKKGARVLRVLEQAPRAQVLGLLPHLSIGKWLEAARLGLQQASIYQQDAFVLSATGTDRLRQVSFTQGQKLHTLECDLLAVGFGLVPNLELPRLLGCALREGFVQVDDVGQTSVSGVYAAGEVTGIGGLEKALLEGELAGKAATSQPIAHLIPRRVKTERFVQALKQAFVLRPEVLQLADPQTVVCRCEDVVLQQLRNHRDWRTAKLHTRLGMGACQGRICGTICEHTLGFPPDGQRPPLLATDLQHLLPEPSTHAP